MRVSEKSLRSMQDLTAVGETPMRLDQVAVPHAYTVDQSYPETSGRIYLTKVAPKVFFRFPCCF